MEHILITGAAGFIGFHLARTLLEKNIRVTGIDNLNDYYDVNLKQNRLKILNNDSNFEFYQIDISQKSRLQSVFEKFKFSHVLHLAAQAGVRYSLENPDVYTLSNLVGFSNILECIRSHHSLKHFVYASTSSVYGSNAKIPFKEFHSTKNPVSYYAATKLSNELAAQSYFSLFKIPITGLRYFTVYGPWGRPDMALFKFTSAIMNDEPIVIYNEGKMFRDFTYIEDVIQATLLTLHTPPSPHTIDHPIYNIGRGQSENLMNYIECIEKNLNKKALKIFSPLQQGEVVKTWGDISKAKKKLGYNPKINIEEGVTNFIAWYKDYHNIV